MLAGNWKRVIGSKTEELVLSSYRSLAQLWYDLARTEDNDISKFMQSENGGSDKFSARVLQVLRRKEAASPMNGGWRPLHGKQRALRFKPSRPR